MGTVLGREAYAPMLYLSGIHALNVSCKLITCGDWHAPALRWDAITLLESEKSIYGNYGIEPGKRIPESEGLFNVADHIRALLDLLCQGKYSVAQGMRDDFICNDSYTEEIFRKVAMQRNMENWPLTDRFMGKEYYSAWLNFKERERI
jgi:hypothetical protein